MSADTTLVRKTDLMVSSGAIELVYRAGFHDPDSLTSENPMNAVRIAQTRVLSEGLLRHSLSNHPSFLMEIDLPPKPLEYRSSRGDGEFPAGWSSIKSGLVSSMYIARLHNVHLRVDRVASESANIFELTAKVARLTANQSPKNKVQLQDQILASLLNKYEFLYIDCKNDMLLVLWELMRNAPDLYSRYASLGNMQKDRKGIAMLEIPPMVVNGYDSFSDKYFHRDRYGNLSYIDSELLIDMIRKPRRALDFSGSTSDLKKLQMVRWNLIVDRLNDHFRDYLLDLHPKF